jgi:hypothetical protein
MTLRNSTGGSLNYNPEPDYKADFCNNEIVFMQNAETDCKEILSLVAKAFIDKDYDIDVGDMEVIENAISNVIRDKYDFLDAKRSLENNNLDDDVFISLGQNTQAKILVNAKFELTEYQELKNKGLIRSNNQQAVLKPFETI